MTCARGRFWVSVLLALIVLAVGLVALLRLQHQRGALRAASATYEPRERVAGSNQPPAPRMTPASEQLDPKALEAAADYAGEHGSLALIVSRHGYIVFERYWAGTSFDTPVDAQALTPLVAALATGVAVSHRLIGWPDEPVGAFLSEWAGDARGAITVRNLLQMTSGLAAPAAATPTGLLARTLAAPLQREPGTQRVEQAGDPELLALVLERAAHQRFAAYLSQTLWRRIGAADAWLWLDHPGGAAHADCCMMARQGDWIRVGELLLRDGNYQGAEVIRPGWVALLRAPLKVAPGFGSYVRLAPTSAHEEPYAAPDLFVAGGSGGHRLWLVPSLQLAILATGPRTGRDAAWDDSRIPNLIVRAARDFVPSSRPADLPALVPAHKP